MFTDLLIIEIICLTHSFLSFPKLVSFTVSFVHEENVGVKSKPDVSFWTVESWKKKEKCLIHRDRKRQWESSLNFLPRKHHELEIPWLRLHHSSCPLSFHVFTKWRTDQWSFLRAKLTPRSDIFSSSISGVITFFSSSFYVEMTFSFFSSECPSVFFSFSPVIIISFSTFFLEWLPFSWVNCVSFHGYYSTKMMIPVQ